MAQTANNIFSIVSPSPESSRTTSTLRLVNNEKSNEIRLVELAQSGDSKAFTMLYERYSRMVHGIILARVPRHEADDLVQDVFLFAFRKMSTLRDAAAFGGWIGMIARNRAMDFHRQKHDSEELTENTAESLTASPSHKAEALAALEAIKSLPEAYRETLLLRLVEGMTGPEIAEQTGLTPDSVRVNLHRGMKMLKEKLNAS